MTHDQIRIINLIFYGATVVVGVTVMSTSGMRGAWRSVLKIIWVGLTLAACTRSALSFARQCTGGIVVVGLFMVAIATAITYRMTHGGWAGWWSSW
jgi:hypothetical protein